MPGLVNDCVFNLDVRQWSRDWRGRKKEADGIGAVEVGYFSRTDGKTVAYSRENLYSFKQPSPKTSLIGSDYKDFQEQSKHYGRWKYLEPHRRCSIDVHRYDIVTGRNVLLNLGMAVYEGRKSFEIDAVTFSDGQTVFMSSHNTASPEQSEMVELRHYWGARFETVCTGRKNVDTESRFFSLMKRKIGRHRVLFTAEIDCKLGGNSSRPPSNYVELKCRKEVDHDMRFMHLYMKYWLQSYLASVPTIFEGVRNEQGRLLYVDRFETETIPEICIEKREKIGKGWNSMKILDFLTLALTKISMACERNVGTTVRVKFDAKEKRLTATLIPDGEYAELVETALLRLENHNKRKMEKKRTESKQHRKQSEPISPQRRGLWAIFRPCFGCF